MIRIIDNKKIDLTDDEWNLYQKIVTSYTTNQSKGEDLFQDLFETNNKGIILFIKPPSTKFTSFEIFLFIMSIQQQQHIRLMYKEIDDLASQIKIKLAEFEAKLQK